MRLNENFFTHEVEDEQIMIDIKGKFQGIVTNNATAAFIVNCLKEETTFEEIVDKMFSEYDAPREQIEKDVKQILEKLKAINAIKI